MEIAGVIVLLLFLAFVTLAVVVTVRTVRTVKHSVSRSTAQARRLVEDSRLRARRFTLLGPAGEIAQLRIDLRTSIDSTSAALEAGRPDDASLAEATALFARLNDHARALDQELRLLEREPDKARLTAHLPALTERTRRITGSADSLRWAAQDRARHFADDDLTALGHDIALEATALRHWTAPQPADPPDPIPPAAHEQAVRPGIDEPKPGTPRKPGPPAA